MIKVRLTAGECVVPVGLEHHIHEKDSENDSRDGNKQRYDGEEEAW